MSELIFEAIQEGDSESLRSILDRDPEAAGATNDQGISAVMFAVYRGRADLAERIAAAKRELTFFEACALGRTTEARRMLEDQPPCAEVSSPDGFTALHLAAYFGHSEIARLLIAKGAAVNQAAENPSRVAPLHSAVAGRSIEVVRMLVEAGADLNARQKGGYTPLMGAAANGQPVLVDYLLASGANPDARSDDGKSARDLAIEKGFSDLF